MWLLLDQSAGLSLGRQLKGKGQLLQLVSSTQVEQMCVIQYSSEPSFNHSALSVYNVCTQTEQLNVYISWQ